MNWSIVSSLLSIVFVYLYLWPLLRNWLSVRHCGFSRYICPISPANPLWMIFGGTLLIPLGKYLPDFVWCRIKYSMHGHQYIDRFRKNPRPAPASAFMYVTPGGNEVWIEDREIAEAVYSRRKDFLVSEQTKNLLSTMGPSVLTSDGQDWQRQRRIVAEALNERISKSVWNESCGQADEMILSFLELPNGETNETVHGLRQIALNVLAFAGYGSSRPWKLVNEKTTTPVGHKLSYADVLSALTNGFILMAFLPIDVLCWKWSPKAVRNVGIAAQEFPTYTNELIEQHRAESEMAERNLSHSFLRSIVQISDEEKRQQISNDSNAMRHLSESEIQGGLWQFSLAGFDTTANTLAYAVIVLAINPAWQDWIIEEVDEVFGSQGSTILYEETFPKLRRCLALMYETLRLFTPIATISRSTNSLQSISASSGTYWIPANTLVYVNTGTMHTDKNVWGPDAHDFCPTRWFTSQEPQSELYVPRETFLPWSSGPRVCPGMKMSKVEFTAVISTIFRQCRCEPALAAGETKLHGVQRIKQLLQNSQPRLTLQLNKPYDVKLAWTKR